MGGAGGATAGTAPTGGEAFIATGAVEEPFESDAPERASSIVGASGSLVTNALVCSSGATVSVTHPDKAKATIADEASKPTLVRFLIGYFSRK